MGQYHYVVNLDKKEFINPHKLGIGLKAWEQIASSPSTPQALFVLLLCSNGRGGGDLARVDGADGPVIGRWAGDRIAVVGDYAEDHDIKAPLHDPVSDLYDFCAEGACREVSDLVRPVLAAELGVQYVVEPRVWRQADSTEHHYDNWRYHRDPSASFSVLDP
jgi:hypothetical protein